MSSRAVDRGLGIYAGFVFAFLYAPIAVVVVYAFNDNRHVETWTRASTRWFGITLGDSAFRGSIVLSVWTALASAAIATVIGTALALALRDVSRRARLLFDGLLYANLVVPEIVMAIASLLLFSALSFPLGAGAIVLTHSVFTISLVTLIVRARLAALGRTLEDASADLGATRAETVRYVLLPQLRPAILAGALLAFTFSFDDVVLSQFVTGPGATTLPLRVFSELRFGLTPRTNVVAVIILVFTITSVAIAQALLRRDRLPRPSAP